MSERQSSSTNPDATKRIIESVNRTLNKHIQSGRSCSVALSLNGKDIIAEADTSDSLARILEEMRVKAEDVILLRVGKLEPD